ncbi:zinc ribbon domain-containing protein [Actinomadura sp. ATCC 31491]|uniref:Zinc ribbon domain-containing protein n=1 Tax=Actinomadura luzonensis TaxID=2805427 RepID=A0ABT0G4X1_9ACTN|nr:zinc ribbon domain-containing protein [Actinomadura luzonensis]MCK2219622.1 zinc ribbon domain-containing protein [Actinomadura luzonensis]
MAGHRPEPDRDSREWWERIARHEFAVQRCAGCGVDRFPARAFCPACRGEEWRWRAVEPEGRVESWIVARQPFVPGVAVPYVVVMVRLSAVPDGLAYGNWRGGREPRAGERVRGVYREEGDVTLVDWEPAG